MISCSARHLSADRSFKPTNPTHNGAFHTPVRPRLKHIVEQLGGAAGWRWGEPTQVPTNSYDLEAVYYGCSASEHVSRAVHVLHAGAGAGADRASIKRNRLQLVAKKTQKTYQPISSFNGAALTFLAGRQMHPAAKVVC